MIDHFSGTLGLFAFAVVILIGMLSGGEFTDVLTRGLAGMFIFLIIGKVLGYIGLKMIQENGVKEKVEEEQEEEAAEEEAAEESSEETTEETTGETTEEEAA